MRNRLAAGFRGLTRVEWRISRRFAKWLKGKTPKLRLLSDALSSGFGDAQAEAGLARSISMFFCARTASEMPVIRARAGLGYNSGKKLLALKGPEKANSTCADSADDNAVRRKDGG